MEGKVKFFNARKGYGFIAGDDGQDYFVHHSQLQNGVVLNENDAVTFEAVDTEKGNQAQKVELAGSAPAAQESPAAEEPAEPAEEEPTEAPEEAAPEETAEEPEEKPAAEPEDTEDFGEEEKKE